MTKKRPKSKSGAFKDRNISSLDQHSRKGKQLLPPFRQLQNISFSSWRDERLPNVLWAVLMAGNLDRGLYLQRFRDVIGAAKDAGAHPAASIMHSDLASVETSTFDTTFAPLFGDQSVAQVLSALLLFETLPDRQHWARHLSPPDPEVHVPLLANAVARAFDHQSEQSTDCRWLKLLFATVMGRFHFPEKMADRVQEIMEYPNRGDLRSVRPSIRASEMIIGAPGSGFDAGSWPIDFWRECWERTVCVPASRHVVSDPDTAPVVKQLAQIYGLVASHFFAVTEDTAINARRDAVFGAVLYGVNLALTLNQGAAHRRVEGRLAIRTLVEIFITLAFLLKRDEETLWTKYRHYGGGQAKLAFLKMFDLAAEDLPSHVDLAELEQLANEDMWHEFAVIDLGSWAGLDLRRMSEEAGAKQIYDKYYGWPSGYVHGQWSAVRDTVFDLCLNPLHRYHRIPNLPKRSMASVATDAVKLVNLLLDLLNRAYPTFKPRVTGTARAVEPEAESGVASDPSSSAEEVEAAEEADAGSKEAPVEGEGAAPAEHEC